MTEETRTFKNTRVSVYHNYAHTYNEVGNGGERFNLDEWDVEFTFTRKVKPFKNGSVVLDTGQDWLYFKVSKTWYFVSTKRPGSAIPSTVTDEEFRTELEAAHGPLRVLHEVV